MSLALQLGIAAGCMQLVAFGLYNQHVFTGKTEPNTTVWFLWAFLALLNASSYTKSTDEPAQYILSNVSATATLLTFFYCLFWGKFKKIPKIDYLVLGMGVVAGFVWWCFKSAAYANLIVVGAVAISFWPLYRSVWKNPLLEKPWPWYVWGVAYGLNTLAVIASWKGEWTALVYPVSMLILHPPVAWLALRKVPAKVPATV